MTGYMDSLPPICMAVDARSPGARKSRYRTPPTGCLTSDPKPEAHGGQIQHRVQEAGGDRPPPRALVLVHPVAHGPHPGGRGPVAPGRAGRRRRASRRVVVSGHRPCPSVDQRPAGEAEEDVFEGGSPDEGAVGSEPEPVHLGEGGLAVVGVEQQAVRERLEALGQRRRRAAATASVSVSGSRKRSSSTSRVEYRAMSSLGEPSAANVPSSMTARRSQSCSASSM